APERVGFGAEEQETPSAVVGVLEHVEAPRRGALDASTRPPELVAVPAVPLAEQLCELVTGEAAPAIDDAPGLPDPTLGPLHELRVGERRRPRRGPAVDQAVDVEPAHQLHKRLGPRQRPGLALVARRARAAAVADGKQDPLGHDVLSLSAAWPRWHPPAPSPRCRAWPHHRHALARTRRRRCPRGSPQWPRLRQPGCLA